MEMLAHIISYVTTRMARNMHREQEIIVLHQEQFGHSSHIVASALASSVLPDAESSVPVVLSQQMNASLEELAEMDGYLTTLMEQTYNEAWVDDQDCNTSIISGSSVEGGWLAGLLKSRS